MAPYGTLSDITDVNAASFDHLVGAGEQHGRDFEAERLQ
jgi:hypothetical protein